MAELLLELYSEEIPSGCQENAAQSLLENITKNLAEHNIIVDKSQYFFSAHRIICVLDNLPLLQEKKLIEKRGPSVNAPQQAIDGFLNANNVKIKDLEIKNTDKGEFYFLNQIIAEKNTSDILQEILPKSLNQIKWPKTMRWGKYNLHWIRPLKNILCIFDENLLKFNFHHLSSNYYTFGHKVLNNTKINIKNFSEYKENLYQNNVIISSDERKSKILNELNKLEEKHNITLVENKSLLNEVSGLAEHPYIMLGNIDNEFMKLPKEVLITSMRSHQKYFSFTDNKGNLVPYFAFVANIKGTDEGKNIIAGNERVLKARLADAKFFWEQDQKSSLENFNNYHEKIIFHSKIGNLAERVQRITAISKFLCVWVPHSNLIKTERAAILSKSDLCSKMVSEFPELQGLIGSYYASNQKEDLEVAIAIKEQYMPAGLDDNLPSTPISITLSLADKLECLISMFAINEKPTGSKDPYALRRAAIGINRIIIDNNLNIPLKIVIDKAIMLLPDKIKKSIGKNQDNLSDEILLFIIERLKSILKGKDINSEYIAAIFNSEYTEDNLLRLQNRVIILEDYLKTDIGYNLLTIYKRANNIVSIATKKENFNPDKFFIADVKLLSEKEEKNLYNTLTQVIDDVNKNIKDEEFDIAMKNISLLYKPLSEFFDNIMVNCDDQKIKFNRLSFLVMINNIINKVANFSYISGVSNGK